MPNDASFLVHDERVWNAVDTERAHVVFASLPFLVQRYAVIHLITHLFDKRLHFRHGLVTDADEGDVFKFLLQLGQVRDAGAARPAPSGPKFDDKNLFAL